MLHLKHVLVVDSQQQDKGRDTSSIEGDVSVAKKGKPLSSAHRDEIVTRTLLLR